MPPSDPIHRILPQPPSVLTPLPVYRCWLEHLPRAGAVGVPSVDEEEAAHRLAELLCQQYGNQRWSICVEPTEETPEDGSSVITIYDVTPKQATIYEVERRRELS